ncbi:hypothetical protein BDM02DRAFT_1211056 [Thelephora ganbajun]|uniref:Uncharacterized protein n=1 Tax=Thelephora ganbajun TaxID=370292 RepID=A0ACB6ZN71_THEGA|nr:hypothetical protein BDM02DRAFT_1211056 [Thelephora ganbajun]
MLGFSPARPGKRDLWLSERSYSQANLGRRGGGYALGVRLFSQIGMCSGVLRNRSSFILTSSCCVCAIKDPCRVKISTFDLRRFHFLKLETISLYPSPNVYHVGSQLGQSKNQPASMTTRLHALLGLWSFSSPCGSQDYFRTKGGGGSHTHGTFAVLHVLFSVPREHGD